MSARKLWYVLTLIAFAIMPLAGCSGGGASPVQTTQKGVQLTVGGKVDVSKAAAKTVDLAAGDANSVTVYDAQNGTALGTAAIDSSGKFTGLTFTMPSAKAVLVFKATVAQGVFRSIVPLDLSNPPAAGIGANNTINIAISKETSDIATAVSAMLGVTGLLGDTGATLAVVNKTYTDAATQVVNNGGQVLAYNTSGLSLTGSVNSSSLLPSRDATTLTYEELNNIALDGKVISAFIPPGSNKPIVNFQVVNKATGKGISGLNSFGLHVAQLKPEEAGGNSNWLNYILQTTTSRDRKDLPSSDTGSTIINHGDGTYTAIFGTDLQNNNAYVLSKKDTTITNNPKLVYDPALIHRIGITVSSASPAAPINPATGATVTSFSYNGTAALVYDFTPATGLMLVDANNKQAYARDIITMEACNQCHYRLANAGGHFGSRPDTRICVMCHTQQNKRANAGSADFTPFIHKIHMGEKLAIGEVIAGVDVHEITYPQDIRNCTMCHKGTDVNNWKTKPTQKSCGSCHNGLDFAAHQGGQTSDQFCAGCHTGATAIKEVAASHMLSDQTGNNPNTPAGLSNFTYTISEVKLNASNQPEFKFQIKKDGTAVTTLAIPTQANLTANATTGQLGISSTFEPIPGFRGGPTFYVVYSVPQDGITAPADFNVRSNVALANLLLAAGSPKQGSLTGPDANGFWTATLTGDTIGQPLPATGTKPAALSPSPILVPASAKMLTGAMIGNFTQVTATGTVARNTKDAIKVATGFTGRRAIVDNAKCNKCHDQLGINPSFHSGARNDATLCAFCHTPNQTSSGWSANASTFVHGIHAAKKRSVPYNWHSAKDAAGNWTLYYPHVTYPGVLRNCEQCHVTGGYDFSSAAAIAALPNMLWTTDARGKYDGASATAYTLSPYVIKDNLYDYGVGFSYTPATDVTVQAAATTLVSSPISAACFACHDTGAAKAHMVSMGGSIYEARGTAMQKTETCLTCHGTAANSLNSSIPTIKSVHRWW